MSSLSDLRKELQKIANPTRAKVSQGFFKTGRGEYGEGDVFLGITVPECRKIAKKYNSLPLGEIKKLLESEIHEERFCALLILIDYYQKAEKEKNEERKKEVYEFYLGNTSGINNWDLVDVSAPLIVGVYLWEKNRKILYELAKSSNLWEKRIAIISTLGFIKKGEFEDTIKISEILLTDRHDLIHKAVGWMLREVGKRNEQILKDFLSSRYKKMPRTMLRYAIEKFPEEIRKRYLDGKV